MKPLKRILKKFNTPYHKRVCNYQNPFTHIFSIALDFYDLVFNYLKYSPIMIREFRKIRSLRGIEKGNFAFVFANGPSLNKLDLHKVRKLQAEGRYKVICLNSYVISSNMSVLKPDYYILSDPAFFSKNPDFITLERVREIKNGWEILKELQIPTFVPIQFSKKVRYDFLYYFNDFEFRWFNNNVTNILYPRSYLSMTAYKALAIACYLGFEKIYICGFDSDWFKSININKQNEIFYNNFHFYKQSDDGVRKVPKDEALNLGELLYGFSFLFFDLYKFPKNIINLDPDSLVDAFSKRHDMDIYNKIV